MAITNAVQRGSNVLIYNERGHCATASGELKGYTSSVVNVERNGWILSFDEKGCVKGQVPSGPSPGKSPGQPADQVSSAESGCLGVVALFALLPLGSLLLWTYV